MELLFSLLSRGCNLPQTRIYHNRSHYVVLDYFASFPRGTRARSIMISQVSRQSGLSLCGWHEVEKTFDFGD